MRMEGGRERERERERCRSGKFYRFSPMDTANLLNTFSPWFGHFPLPLGAFSSHICLMVFVQVEWRGMRNAGIRAQ